MYCKIDNMIREDNLYIFISLKLQLSLIVMALMIKAIIIINLEIFVYYI